VGLYAQNVKYPANGTSNQPLELVYASPSYNEQENIMFGIFIYKVNHDYVPRPQSDPYSPQEPAVADDNATAPEEQPPMATMPTPTAQMMTSSR
jgi:hypothetical protein